MEREIFISRGKLTLLKSVLQAIPVYYISFMNPSSATVLDFGRLLANFFWHDKEGVHKHHWVSWKICCLPQDEGGLGLRNFKDVANAFSLKLWWRYRSQSSLWAKFLSAKYANSSHPLLAHAY